MKTDAAHTKVPAPLAGRASLRGAHLRTLEALFRHPTAHNLEWMDVVTLMEKIGSVQQEGDQKFAFQVGNERYQMHKPHAKDLNGSEVADLRNFLRRAGWSADSSPTQTSDATTAPLTLMAVVDHHGARIYRLDESNNSPSKREIRPYDPHHFLHHLAHKDQSREEGQHAPEDTEYYERIGQALSAAAQIVVVGHGTGNSNAARHLTGYLRTHHRETYQRIVQELEADLSAITTPELLALAERSLGTAI